MKKVLLLIPAILLLASCNKKEMQLSRAAFIVEEGVDDHSPIYFETGEDGKAININEANRIAGTNYIVSIQRDLNVKEVLQEIKRIKDHKYAEDNMHRDEKGVYLSYADTLHKHLSLFPIKGFDYGFVGPTTQDKIVYLKDANNFLVEGKAVTKDQLLEAIKDKDSLQLGVNKDLTYETYLQTRIFLIEKEVADKFLKTDLIY